MKKFIQLVNEAEHATLLAALRLYQTRVAADWPAQIRAIATDGGRFASLDADKIDALCERLNFGDGAAPVREVLQLAIRRAETELGRWPENDVDSTEHRAVRYALGRYQALFDQLS